jgi:single-stranded-DNA-specific exonuclease
MAQGLLVAAPVRWIKEIHIKLALEDPETGRRYQALGWGRGTNWSDQVRQMGLGQGTRVDVAFRVRRNLHPDFGGLELEIVALRIARN